jgi:ABC-2 type transport system permease protein
MTAATATAVAATDLAALRSARTRPALSRLVAVELRKMTDTRAGFWLQLGVVALTVAIVAVVCIAGETADRTLLGLLSAATAPSNILLPVVGILLVASEWSQRSTLVTFTLVPDRSRVFAAKLLAGLLLSVAALVVSLAVAVIGTAVAGSGAQGAWSLPPGMIGQVAFQLAASMAIGVGFGALMLSPAPAIVLHFALPLALSALGSLSFLHDAAPWFDTNRSLFPLGDHLMSATEWTRAGTSLALIMVLPLLIGLWRIRRSEVS